MSDSMPSAIILAKNPRSGSLDELKVYKNNDIFLNNGDEFQIRLFNPLKEKIGVQIGFNGKSSSHYLVLNPGEDVIIDRFIDDKKRMVFETYKYDDNNPSAKNAVANNGLVEIKFYKEYFYNPPVLYNTTTTYNPYYINVGTGGFHSTGPLNLSSLKSNSTTFTNTSNVVSDTSCNYVNLEFANEKTKSLKETGRIEKGKESEQNFQNVQVQFESYHFHSISYYLRPFSEKESYVKHDIREYCNQCRYRIKNKTFIYCPKCGNKL